MMFDSLAEYTGNGSISTAFFSGITEIKEE